MDFWQLAGVTWGWESRTDDVWTVLREVNGWGAFFCWAGLSPVPASCVGSESPSFWEPQGCVCDFTHPSLVQQHPTLEKPSCWVSCVIPANNWVILHLLMLPGKAGKPVVWSSRCLIQNWLIVIGYVVYDQGGDVCFTTISFQRNTSGSQMAVFQPSEWVKTVHSLFEAFDLQRRWLHVSRFL